MSHIKSWQLFFFSHLNDITKKECVPASMALIVCRLCSKGQCLSITSDILAGAHFFLWYNQIVVQDLFSSNFHTITSLQTTLFIFYYIHILLYNTLTSQALALLYVVR